MIDTIEKIALDSGYYQYYFSKFRTNSTYIASIRSLAFIRNYFYPSSYVHAFDVTTITVIPHIAGASLTKANSLYQMVNQLASLFGPMIAGVFISFIGGFHVLWINVLSFIATLIAVMMLPSIKNKNKRTEDKNSFQNILTDLFDGFKWLKRIS